MIQIMRARATLMRKHWTPVARAFGLLMLLTGVGLRAAGSHVWRRRIARGASIYFWNETWRARRHWLRGYDHQSRDGTVVLPTVTTIANIEARMGSSRLPGKVLMPVAGVPVIEHLVARLRRVPSVDQILIATTVEPGDDVLAEFAERVGVSCFRGSEEDVMGRVIGAGESVGADLMVEIMGDSPLVDPDIVEQCIRMAVHNEADYTSNVVVRSYPTGMGVQVFPLDILRRSAALTSDPCDREHVTRHIRLNPDLFSHLHLVAPPSLHRPDLELVLDEPADLALIRGILEAFDGRPDFGCLEVIGLADERPDLFEAKREMGRKGL